MTTHPVAPGGLPNALATCQQGDEIVLLPGLHPPVSGPRREDAETWTHPVTVRAEDGARLTRLSLRQPHITLDGVTFVKNPEEDDDPATPDGSLLYLTPQAHHFVLTRSRIFSTGIMVRASHVQITDNDISGLSPDGTPGQQLDGVQIGNGATDVFVARNKIHDFPYEDPSGYHPDGVQLFDCKRVVVIDNEVWNIGNSALILSGGRGWGIDQAVVARNVLLSDKGAVDVREPSAHGIVFIENEVGNLRLGVEKADGTLKGLVADRLLVHYLGLKESRPTNSVIEATNPGFGAHVALTDASLGNRRSESEPITLVAPRGEVSEWAAQWLDDVPDPTPDPTPHPTPEPTPEPDVPVEPEPEPEPPAEPQPEPPADPLGEFLELQDRVEVLESQLASLLPNLVAVQRTVETDHERIREVESKVSRVSRLIQRLRTALATDS